MIRQLADKQVSNIIDSDLHECEMELFKRAGSIN
jgi:hypothetical protein